MNITETVLQNLSWHLEHPLCTSHKSEICVINAAYKALIVIAQLVVRVVSPLLWLCEKSFLAFTLSRSKNIDCISILHFYRGGKNDKGITLEEIWKWNDKTLEEKHDFIQWLFPLKTIGTNPTSALTNEETIAAFNKEDSLRLKLMQSFDIMLKFYGFIRDNNGHIEMGPNFDEKAQNWLQPLNHNYLRISRILESLSLHGLKPTSHAFFEVLQKVYNKNPHQIGQKTFDIWKMKGQPQIGFIK